MDRYKTPHMGAADQKGPNEDHGHQYEASDIMPYCYDYTIGHCASLGLISGLSLFQNLAHAICLS
jgi:hypothetical protein